MENNIIMVDCDGVLLDFNKGFAQSYYKLFNKHLSVVRENAYAAVREFGLEEYGNYKYFTKLFEKNNINIWEKLPELKNAVNPINRLIDKGYDVRCLTSMNPKYEKDRLYNLQSLGFKIDIVYPVCRSTAAQKGIRNPKLEILKALKPIAFIDDLLTNFLDCENLSTKFYLLDNEYAKGENPNELITEPLNYQVVKSLDSFVDLFPDLKKTNTNKIKS